MKIEKIIQNSINELEREIKYRNTDEWLEQTREGEILDSNGYFWLFRGESEKYNGRLEGLKQALEIIKKND